MTNLQLAAILAFLVGAIHSILGERYILTRLFRRDSLPTLLGGTEFTRQTIRFAWHLTTVAWWGIAAMLWQASSAALDQDAMLRTIGWTFLVSGLFPLIATRGKHLAWILFFAIGAIALTQVNP